MRACSRAIASDTSVSADGVKTSAVATTALTALSQPGCTPLPTAAQLDELGRIVAGAARDLSAARGHQA
ncbi:hypothetical protein [Lentzea sp. NPDC055074]